MYKRKCTIQKVNQGIKNICNDCYTFLFFFDPFPKRTIFQHAIKQQKKINDLAIIMICILYRVFATVTA